MTTPSSALVEKRNELDAKRKQLADATQKAKNANGTYDDAILAKELGVQPGTQLEGELTKRRREMNDLGTQCEAMATAEDAKRWGDTGDPPLPTGQRKEHMNARKGLGTLFVESKAYTDRKSRQSDTVQIDVKTLMQSDTLGGGGWAPFSPDLPGYTPFAVRQPQIINFIPRFRTTQSAIPFMEETTHTDNAVEKAQGATAGEQAYVFTRQTRTVERIPASIPVTDEQLDDVVGIEDFLNQALTGDVLRRLDLQCMAGNGTTPNLAGILDHASIQTYALNNEPVYDAIHKAITKVNVTGRGRANVIFLHSNDWQDIVLTRTADGIYLLGNPGGPVQRQLWGLPVVPNEANTENTGLVGDSTFTGLYVRQEITFQIGYSGTQFVEGEKTCLATLRAAMVVRSGAKFCTVTNI